MMQHDESSEMLRDEVINLQWFPGHMAKTRRLITEHLKQVDLAAEILDARIPRSSRNPIIDELLGNKPRIVLLNKSDLADQDANKSWQAYFKGKGINTVMIDSLSGKGISNFKSEISRALHEKLQRDKSKGMTKAPRVMILGIPNVGKSSFINRISGEKKAKAEDRPGVTRGKQWIYVDGLQLLDTPGILWPKFEDRETAMNLAFTGAIRDDIYDVQGVAAALVKKLYEIAPKLLCERYKIEATGEDTGLQLLTRIGKKRGFLIAGGEIDLERTARIVLDEFRAAKIGRITLELPEGESI